mmetsp:Transcript_29994/g.77115  ORF Transcript_29994/g.77115 Transcript_29994/m.77115 type:complete len:280 (-) Transcript_29994:4627-5466(-)
MKHTKTPAAHRIPRHRLCLGCAAHRPSQKNKDRQRRRGALVVPDRRQAPEVRQSPGAAIQLAEIAEIEQQHNATNSNAARIVLAGALLHRDTVRGQRDHAVVHFIHQGGECVGVHKPGYLALNLLHHAHNLRNLARFLTGVCLLLLLFRCHKPDACGLHSNEEPQGQQEGCIDHRNHQAAEDRETGVSIGNQEDDNSPVRKAPSLQARSLDAIHQSSLSAIKRLVADLRHEGCSTQHAEHQDFGGLVWHDARVGDNTAQQQIKTLDNQLPVPESGAETV